MWRFPESLAHSALSYGPDIRAMDTEDPEEPEYEGFLITGPKTGDDAMDRQNSDPRTGFPRKCKRYGQGSLIFLPDADADAQNCVLPLRRARQDGSSPSPCRLLRARQHRAGLPWSRTLSIATSIDCLCTCVQCL